MGRRLFPASACTLWTLLAACQVVPPPPPPPPEPTFTPSLEFHLRSYAGTLLSGSLPQEVVEVVPDPEQALSLHCDVFFVEQLPEAGLQPAVTAARLVLATPWESLLLPTVQLARGMGAASGSRAEAVVEELRAGGHGRFERYAGALGALPAGVSAVFYVQQPVVEGSHDPRPIQPGVALTLSRSAEEPEAPLELAISVSGEFEVPLEPTAELLLEAEGPTALEYESIMRSEVVVLEARLAHDEGPLVVALPSPFADGTASALVLILQLVAPPAPGAHGADIHPALVERCLARIERESQLAKLNSSALQPEERNWIKWHSAHQTLLDRGLRRPAMVSLAGLCGAPLAGDLALTLEAEELDAFVQLLLDQGLKSPQEPEELSAVAWALERTAYTQLAAELEEEQLARDLAALLKVHAGELGHYPGSIADLCEASPDLPTFHEYLIQENLIFLEDPNPSARLRAYDWLAARDRDPEGYDPLGPAQERRAALARFEEALEEAALEAGGNPR